MCVPGGDYLYEPCVGISNSLSGSIVGQASLAECLSLFSTTDSRLGRDTGGGSGGGGSISGGRHSGDGGGSIGGGSTGGSSNGGGGIRPRPPFVDESLVWPSQEGVAKRLFRRTQHVLGDRNISDFRGMEFLVLTPGFLTLQHQTMNRLAKSGLLPPGKVASSVIMYMDGADQKRIFSGFKDRATNKEKDPEEEKKLFVMIADECHHSATKNGPHDKFVNDPELIKRRNFVLLGVRTRGSRVNDTNVVEWFEADKNKGEILDEGNYRSSEYYLGTVSFKASPDASTLRGELICTSGNDHKEFGIDFEVSVVNKPFSKPQHVADALSKEFERSINEHRGRLISETERVWPRKRTATWVPSKYINIIAIYEANRFWFSLKHNKAEQDFHFHLLLHNGPTSILPKLGYDDSVEVKAGHPVPGKTSWTIGDGTEHGGRSLRDQRIRSDEAFGELIALLKRQLQLNSGEGAQSAHGHAGHILLADYLYSLVFLSIFRENGRTMRIIDGVERAKNMAGSSDVKRFKDKLDGLCKETVNATDDETQIKKAFEEVRKIYFSEAKKELLQKRPEPEPTEMECLGYILEQKLIGSSVADSTSNECGWFNETDRLLQDIVSNDPDRGHGHGQMVVMRVYNKETQRSMQHCLRQAVKTLNIHDGSSEKHPVFSVVSDNGDSKHSLSTNIEWYFMNEFNLLNAGAEAGTYTLQNRKQDLPGGDLSYADLLNVPMILILCDKGRTGDTFPHSLGYFDLRIRTAEGNFATFEQELGRLCRYQSFKRMKGSGASGCSRSEAMELGRAAFNRRREVKVSSYPSSTSLGVANTWWQLEDILNKAEEAEVHPVVRLEESEFPLPTMLITISVMDSVHEAINEHRKANPPRRIAKCIRLDKLDQHMVGSMKNVKIEELHKYVRFLPSRRHFDSGRGGESARHERRMILSAECQVGKTGAYLHYLKLLARAASPIPLPPQLGIKEKLPKDVVSWLLPHWRTLSGKTFPGYGQLLPGKYTADVAKERTHLVVESCRLHEGWVAKFQELLRGVSGEAITSSAGNYLIAKLEKLRLDAPFNQQGRSRGADSYASLKRAIDWDGRFSSYGVQLCVCEDQCTETCRSAVANVKYGTCIPLRIADLAITGGQHGGVRARWEAVQDPKAANFLGDYFVAKQPLKTWFRNSNPLDCESHFEGGGFAVSVPQPDTLDSLLSNKSNRWIFTPSFNRYKPGAQQALLDRASCGLPTSRDGRRRDNVQVLVVRPEQFESYRDYFGSRYVIMALPASMPESPSPSCSPKDGGIGYARRFIQLWSKANGIPFVWVLDDNVQLCHELDVEAGGGEYKPCSFTHVMDSLERLMRCELEEKIEVPTAPDAPSATRFVRGYVNNAGVPDEACPPQTYTLRKPYGDQSRELPPVGRAISTVGDLCGRPGHYGVIGIARHGHSRKTNEDTTQVEPFGVSHSVYSFYLLNVESTVSKGALYPMKRYWEDIEFNRIVEEKGLLVCMFRKFSHSKKNLQPVERCKQRPASPAPLTPQPQQAFHHEDIDLTALQQMYEHRSTFVIEHMNRLLEYLTKEFLHQSHVCEVIYPQEDGCHVPTGYDSPFKIEPAVQVTESYKIAIATKDDAKGSVVIMLLGGIRNESLGVLKGLITYKMFREERAKVVVVTRLPPKAPSREHPQNHIGKWLEEQEWERDMKVFPTIVKPTVPPSADGIVVLVFSAINEEPPVAMDESNERTVTGQTGQISETPESNGHRNHRGFPRDGNKRRRVPRRQDAAAAQHDEDSTGQPETDASSSSLLDRNIHQSPGARSVDALLWTSSDTVSPPSPPTIDLRRSFLDKVVESLENSEFDPKLALEWINNTGQRSGICQENFASEIDVFVDASYAMIANAQLGKTKAFLYLMFKAGVRAGMPSILLTQSNSTEPARFEASIEKLNNLLKEHGRAVENSEPAFQGFEVPLLKMTDKPAEFDGILEPFSNKDGGDVPFIPVFVSLAKFNQIKDLVKSADSPAGGKDTVCCMLRKHGFVSHEGRRRLKAMIVFDEADQNINASVDEIPRALFREKRSVGESGDSNGYVVKADLFDIFSATVDVTATPHSLVYGKRDLTKRQVGRIITGSPSKHGFQYEKRPGWESKLIDRMQVHASNGLASMIDHMVADGNHVRNRHAAVVNSEFTRAELQRTQALHYAATYASNELITATWSEGGGVSVFTAVDPENDSSIAHKIVHISFNLTTENAGNVIEVYRVGGGTYWETAEKFKERIRRTVQSGVEGAAAAGGDARPPLTQEETQSKVDEAKAGTEMVTIAAYSDPKGTYPTFLDHFVEAAEVVAADEGIPLRDIRVNTVVFGKEVMERGVTVKGATSHACGLTDMYVQVEPHYTLLVEVCGRLCGNHYHVCDGSCPGHGNQEVCPLERKILWATKEVHDKHQNALKFIHFLVETAAKAGDSGMTDLENLLHEMERTVAEAALYRVTEASLKRNTQMNNDFMTMQMMAWKAAGGKFAFENKIRANRKRLEGVEGYQADVEINGRTVRTTPTVWVDDSSQTTTAADTHQFDESSYFFGNFRDLLRQMREPGYDAIPKMSPDFKDFLAQRAVNFVVRGVFAMRGQRPGKNRDFIEVDVDSSGDPHILRMKMYGSQDGVMKKYEKVCREEDSKR